MDILHSALGYCALLALAWLAGRRSRAVPWKTVAVATALQLSLAGLLLETGLRHRVFGLVGALTGLLKATALKANESLLFSGVSNTRFNEQFGPIVALEIGAILIFVASLSRML